MYLEGLGFHSIGRLLNVSHVSVKNWVKKYDNELSKIRNPKPVQIMELDDIHTYVGVKKNYKWVWTAVDRGGIRHFLARVRLLFQERENDRILFAFIDGKKK